VRRRFVPAAAAVAALGAASVAAADGPSSRAAAGAASAEGPSSRATGQADHLGARAAVPRVKRRADDLRFVLSLDEVGRGTTFHLRSKANRKDVEGRVVKAGRGAVRWVRDAGERSGDEASGRGRGNSDHREFSLAGLPAAKLGVPDEPVRHTAADTPDRLQPRAFVKVRAIVERLLG
jgi:hypothetical protein